MPSLNDALNLVLPIGPGDGKGRPVALHTPISREVFEANYRLLGAVKANLMAKGATYNVASGPVVAALTLKDEGRKDALENGEQGDGGAQALLGELKRLTVVLVPGKDGWETVPVDTAIARGHLDAEDWSETESALVFFTCHCAMARRADRAAIVSATASILKGSTTSSTATAYLASLPTWMNIEPSAVKAESSVPS